MNFCDEYRADAAFFREKAPFSGAVYRRLQVGIGSAGEPSHISTSIWPVVVWERRPGGYRRFVEPVDAQDSSPTPGQYPRQRLAQRLWLLADLTQAASTRREFRSRAYRQAVWSLDALSPELDESAEEMQSVPGIGSGVVRLIREFKATDSLGTLERQSQRMPIEAAQLRRLPGMTANRLRQLKAELGIETENDLLEAIRNQGVQGLKGVGAQTLRIWLDRLQMWQPEGMPAFAAHNLARSLKVHIERYVADTSVTASGAVRRLDEWVEEVDLLISGNPGQSIKFLENSALVTARVDTGEEAPLFSTLAGPVRFHLSAGGDSAWILFVSTGPTQHVAEVERRLAGQPAVSPIFESEAQIYQSVGSRWVPPPARVGKLPVPADLIQDEHLQGDLHVHSDWSPDGRQSLQQMIGSARSRGLKYLVITDHAKGLRFGGLTEEDLRRQRLSIDEARRLHPELAILQGAELNIDREGRVDFDDSVLEQLDLVVAGVHSFFTLSASEQTERVLRAMTNPHIDVIAHLTGRRVGIRPSIELDLRAVLEAASATRTALEVNGHLDRMDLSAEMTAQAKEAGVLFAANSDAHRGTELANVDNAVGILQRAHVRKDQVINSWDLLRLQAWAWSDRG